MKRALVAVLVLTLSCGALFAADKPPAADPKRRVSAVLEGFPAEAPAKKDALCAEILSLGPGAVAEVCARVLPPGTGDDSRARFAVNGLAVHVMRPGAEAERTLVARVLLDSLARTSDARRRRVLPLSDPARRQAGVDPAPREVPRRRDARRTGHERAPRDRGTEEHAGDAEGPGRGAPQRPPRTPAGARRDPQPRGGEEDPAVRGQRGRERAPGGPLRPRQHRRSRRGSRPLAVAGPRLAPRASGCALALSPLRPAPGRVRAHDRRTAGGPRDPRELPPGRGVAARVRGPRPGRLERWSTGPARPSHRRGQSRPGLPRLRPHARREDPGERGHPALGGEGRHRVARRHG